MIRYPKIETLYERDKDTFAVTDTLKLSEFGLIDSKQWILTEKIDGMNIRISPTPTGLDVRGRGDNAQIPGELTKHIYEKLGNLNLWQGVFSQLQESPPIPCGELCDHPEHNFVEWEKRNDITLFGEGFGAGIQKGGGYGEEKQFILFDVKVGEWWLNWKDVEDVAEKLGILCTPIYPSMSSLTDISAALIEGLPSQTGPGRLAEGIVARTDPTLFTRHDTRVMWKLKTKDYK